MIDALLFFIQVMFLGMVSTLATIGFAVSVLVALGLVYKAWDEVRGR